jgi:hypothetical protein
MLTNLTLPMTAAQVVAGTATQNKAITCMQICNITNLPAFEGAVTINVNVYAVPNGQTASQSTLIYCLVPITAGDTFIVDTERLVLGDGDSIWAECDTADAAIMTVSTVGI